MINDAFRFSLGLMLMTVGAAFIAGEMAKDSEGLRILIGVFMNIVGAVSIMLSIKEQKS